MKSADHQKSAVQAIHELRCLALAGDIAAVAAIRDTALFAIGILENLTIHATTPDLPDNYVEAGKNALQLAKESRVWPVAYHSIQEIREPHLGIIKKDKKIDGTGRIGRMEIGSATGIKLTGKRGMTYTKPTGFALDVFDELDAIRKKPAGHRHPTMIHPDLAGPGILTPAQNYRTWRHLAAELKPLSKASVKQWEDAAVEYCRDLCRAKPEPCQWRHRMGKDGLEIIPEDMFVDWSKFPFPAAMTAKAGKKPSADSSERTIESAIRGKISEGLNQLILQSRPRK